MATQYQPSVKNPCVCINFKTGCTPSNDRLKNAFQSANRPPIQRVFGSKTINLTILVTDQASQQKLEEMLGISGFNEKGELEFTAIVKEMTPESGTQDTTELWIIDGIADMGFGVKLPYNAYVNTHARVGHIRFAI